MQTDVTKHKLLPPQNITKTGEKGTILGETSQKFCMKHHKKNGQPDQPNHR